MKTTGEKNTVNPTATEASKIESNASDYGSNLSQPGDGGADCVHQLFEALAAKEPERLAVTSRQGSLTVRGTECSGRTIERPASGGRRRSGNGRRVMRAAFSRDAGRSNRYPQIRRSVPSH